MDFESINGLIGDYEAWHEASVERFVGRLREAEGVDPVIGRFGEYLRRPGKRLRPLLLILAAEAGGCGDRGMVMPAAFSVEAFHTFILIHDDVIDESASRRGRPSLHRDLVDGLGMPLRRGESLAVVLGDLLYGYALEVLNEVTAGPGIRATAIRYFSRVIQDTGLGEALELSLAERPLADVTEAAIETVYQLKTTRYTFEAPLVLGAVLSGLPDGAQEVLERYARPVGRAFQIANDLHEIREVIEGRTELAYDLSGEIRTLYMLRLMAAVGAGDVEQVERWAGGEGEGIAGIVGLVRSDKGVEIYGSLREEVLEGFRQGRQILAAAIDEGILPIRFASIADLVEARFEHSEAFVSKK